MSTFPELYHASTPKATTQLTPDNLNPQGNLKKVRVMGDGIVADTTYHMFSCRKN